MPPEWVKDAWDYLRWFEGVLHELGGYINSEHGILRVTEVYDLVSDAPVALMVDRFPEQTVGFWEHPNQHVIFNLVIDVAQASISHGRFVLRETDPANPDRGGDDVLVRLCRDDVYIPMLNAAWHLHKGSDGEREAQPDMDDWDFRDVLMFLRGYQG